jgi:hypothetical protein
MEADAGAAAIAERRLPGHYRPIADIPDWWEYRAMTVHAREDLDRSARFARREFSHALMSDTKWRKLFAAVDEAGVRPERILVKFMRAPQPAEMIWPGLETQHAPWPWIDSGLGPIELRTIEWILIPTTFQVPRWVSNVPPAEVHQDLDRIEEVLTQLGQFPVERTAEGLRITGYRR